MDAFGHVNNVTYLRYLEEARFDLVAAEGESTAFVAVVARQEISYRRPLRHRTRPVVIEVWVAELDDRSFTLAYEVKDAPGKASPSNVVYASARTVMVPYDLDASRRRSLSAEERRLYSRYLEAAG
jgi:acyl-CoA thioester hydrolase